MNADNGLGHTYDVILDDVIGIGAIEVLVLHHLDTTPTRARDAGVQQTIVHCIAIDGDVIGSFLRLDTLVAGVVDGISLHEYVVRVVVWRSFRLLTRRSSDIDPFTIITPLPRIANGRVSKHYKARV